VHRRWFHDESPAPRAGRHFARGRRPLPRWLRILVGPLPASLLLLPFLLAGAAGTLMAMFGRLLDPAHGPGEPWRAIGPLASILIWVAGASAGVAALWSAVWADSPAVLRQSPRRWWLTAGLLIGLISAMRWLLVMAGHGGYDVATWLVC